MAIVKALKIFTCTTAMLLTSMHASAGVIVASGDSNLSNVSTFYANMFGGKDVFATDGWSVTNSSSTMSAAAQTFSIGALSAQSLSGKEWFVASTNNTYSVSQLGLIASFVAGGGNLFVIGEEHSTYGSMNVVANAVLQAVGSTMTIGAPQGSPTTWTSSGSNVGVNPFTVGVTSIGGNYAGVVNGGSKLFANNANGNIILAMENLSTGPAPVPEPATLAMFALGLLGVGAARRMKK